MVAKSPMQLSAESYAKSPMQLTANKENKRSFQQCLTTVGFCGWLGFLVLQGLGFWICLLGLEFFSVGSRKFADP